MNAATKPGLRSWMFAMLVILAGMLYVLGAGRAHAAPAAGTVIGNQATATYTDAGNTTRNATSNLVQTTVSQVKSYTLDTTGQTRTAAPGQTVYYPHYITNTGNGTDTYALNAATSGTFGASAFVHGSLAYYLDADGNGSPDNATPITSSGPLAAGGVFRFVVAGTVPGGVTSPNNVATITVSATDTAATPSTKTNTDTTTVANSVLTTTKSLSVTSGAGGVTVGVTLAYTNSGTAAATAIEINDPLPANMTYVTGSARWSVSGAGTALTEAADAEQGGAIDFSVTGTTVTAKIPTVNAGVSGTITFNVTIPANLSPQSIPNTANYKTATQTVASNTNTATYTVVQVAGVAFNGVATSSTADGAGVDDPLVVASAAAGATITYDHYVWNTGNASDTFDITTVSSNFPAGTSVGFFQQDGVTTLINSSGTAAADTGPIPGRNATCAAPFVSVGGVCGYKVVVKVTLPATATAAGAPFNLVLRATSAFNTTILNDKTNTLTTIASNSVDLTNDVVSPTTVGNGEGVGTTAIIKDNAVTPAVGSSTATRFMVFVRNEGSITDTYNLTSSFAASGVAGVTALPAGWSIAFRASSNGTDCNSPGSTITASNALAANAAQLVCAEVWVPATTSGTARPGTYDFDFRATSQTNGAVTDVIRDRVTVATVRSISLTPNNTQQTFPGSSVTYSHTIANTGNVDDTVNFNAGCLADSRSGQSWTSTAYIDANTNATLEVGTDTLITCGTTTLNLAMNATRTIFVRVFAPGSAAASDPQNVTTLTATYSVAVSATDSTSVTDGLLLVKEQVLPTPGGCTNNNPSGYTQSAIAAAANTAPGSCIAYRITATNTTAGTITNVVISDNVPSNTKVHNACSGNNRNAPSVWVGGTELTTGITQAVANGASGTLKATIPTLTSTQSAVLYFCVQIDP